MPDILHNSLTNIYIYILHYNLIIEYFYINIYAMGQSNCIQTLISNIETLALTTNNHA